MVAKDDDSCLQMTGGETGGERGGGKREPTQRKHEWSERDNTFFITYCGYIQI